jgi:hypothetical protein
MSQSLVLILFCFIHLSFNDPKDRLQTPPESKISLFYIQRSSNANLVIYDANLLADKKLNPKNPVHTYWLRIGDGGQKQELTTIQKTLAYGLYTNPIVNEVESYEGYFLAYRKRKFVVKIDSKGAPIALFPINGRLQILKKVFVSVNEEKFMPSVYYIELFGKDPVTGKDVYERFKP